MAPSVHLKLVGLRRNDGFLDRSFDLTNAQPSIIVGRSSSKRRQDSVSPKPANAYFSCPVVSRRHAEIGLSPDMSKVTITDLRSLHGTQLNGTKLLAQRPYDLVHGDLVHVGNNMLDGSNKYLAVIFRVEITRVSLPSKTPPRELIDLSSPPPAFLQTPAAKPSSFNAAFATKALIDLTDNEPQKRQTYSVPDDNSSPEPAVADDASECSSLPVEHEVALTQDDGPDGIPGAQVEADGLPTHVSDLASYPESDPEPVNDEGCNDSSEDWEHEMHALTPESDKDDEVNEDDEEDEEEEVESPPSSPQMDANPASTPKQQDPKLDTAAQHQAPTWSGPAPFLNPPMPFQAFPTAAERDFTQHFHPFGANSGSENLRPFCDQPRGSPQRLVPTLRPWNRSFQSQFVDPFTTEPHPFFPVHGASTGPGLNAFTVANPYDSLSTQSGLQAGSQGVPMTAVREMQSDEGGPVSKDAEKTKSTMAIENLVSQHQDKLPVQQLKRKACELELGQNHPTSSMEEELPEAVAAYPAAGDAVEEVAEVDASAPLAKKLRLSPVQATFSSAPSARPVPQTGRAAAAKQFAFGALAGGAAVIGALLWLPQLPA